MSQTYPLSHFYPAIKTFDGTAAYAEAFGISGRDVAKLPTRNGPPKLWSYDRECIVPYLDESGTRVLAQSFTREEALAFNLPNDYRYGLYSTWLNANKMQPTDATNPAPGHIPPTPIRKDQTARLLTIDDVEFLHAELINQLPTGTFVTFSLSPENDLIIWNTEKRRFYVFTINNSRFPAEVLHEKRNREGMYAPGTWTFDGSGISFARVGPSGFAVGKPVELPEGYSFRVLTNLVGKSIVVEEGDEPSVEPVNTSPAAIAKTTDEKIDALYRKFILGQ